MPRGLAVAMGVQAVVLVVAGIGLVVAPTGLREWWPWALTPLTSRVIGAWFVALGFAAGLAIHERDLSRLRSAAITYVVFGLLEAGALVRYRDDVEWDSAAAWLYVALLCAVAATGAFGWWSSVRQDGRRTLDRR
jgi:hypothetical protein